MFTLYNLFRHNERRVLLDGLPVYLVVLSLSTCFAAEKGALIVTEPAGIRRFSYPVQAVLAWSQPLPEGTKFQLMYDGKPIPAQFRITNADDDPSAKVVLDFDASFLPNESRTYEIQYGAEVVPPEEPPPGMSVEEYNDHYLVRHTNYLAWKVPKNLRGFLASVKTPELEFLRPESAGFVVKLRDRDLVQVGEDESLAEVAASRIVKDGPVQCELEFDVTIKNSIQPLDSRIHLSFPRTKSWVRVDWTVDDDPQLVEEIGIDLNFNVAGAPTLVDFGAGSLVYAPLATAQSILMKGARIAGEREWMVLRGSANKLEPYVVRSAAFPGPPEGWAHVMDGARCTAISVAEFGQKTGDTIHINADGRTQILRGDFENESPKKSLRIWYHFVTMPMHVGAATSPQSMLTPLQTEWKPGQK